MRELKYLFLVVDLGFIAYWLLTLFHIIPLEHLFSDYSNPIMVDRGWSFLPLDLSISFSGLGSIYAYERGKKAWKNWAIVSLVLTFTSGLKAISFWFIRLGFDLSWWLLNGFLLIYPLFYLPKIIKTTQEE